ncbi:MULTISPECIES: YdcF family protein [unclassified Acinetobacter]|uniref:YdcF family protein n=1 Tax=unclassified Acinetobacter TaxID=196816 RepID=UPI00293502EC|nr:MULTISPECIES: YdcF family protein [unclassified Acinetobacter]WOE32317.1 YdcF family protein [Acinetobacter sp. SAAs470]WOE37789.1 YdcF family protein [Acinetobacter sp. SAAs474]
MKKVDWMVRIVQVAAALFVLIGCLVLFVYSPFYSKAIVKLLNSFVSVEVNQIAAKSQKLGELNDDDTLEPGSNLWIARQAYLKLLEEDIQQHNSQNITLLQQRYKILIHLINQENLQEKEAGSAVQVPMTSPHASSEAEADRALAVRELLELNSSENKELMDKYRIFLSTHQVQQHDLGTTDYRSKDLNLTEEINDMPDQSDAHRSIQQSKPYAIVVLGGGLALDQKTKNIVVNQYTRLRLEKTLEIEKQYHLPIVLSGVEAPYMQQWLKERGVNAKLLENRSMNTCENTRFSSLLLQKKGGAPTVILITDQYHMPRTRRLFALNGIETIPVEAPIPTQLTTWRPSAQNYDHSRRANYELLATVRDVIFGLSDCREIP